jgi:hypothetical protein
VHVVNGGHYPQELTGFASTAGLHPCQAVYFTPGWAGYGRKYGWIRSVAATSVSIPQWPMNGPVVGLSVRFFASGPLGWADVVVEDGGTLGGTGGHGGNVLVNAGGVFRPGTPAVRVSDFHIGGNTGFVDPTGYANAPGLVGNLEFGAGTSPRAPLWQVDIDATSDTASVVHVTGDITLGDGAIEPVFHNTAKRLRGVWTIATFGGNTTGKMTAPPGCKVLVNHAEKIIQLVSSEPGTLFLLK